MDEQPTLQIPFAEQAVIDQDKLVDYLLNPSHPDGQGKARFFAHLGFNRERPDELRTALRELALSVEVVERDSLYGRKFVGTGTLRSPSGPTGRVTTVWIMLDGQPPPRLVTAYPA
jgi:hypothetical protein